MTRSPSDRTYSYYARVPAAAVRRAPDGTLSAYTDHHLGPDAIISVEPHLMPWVFTTNGEAYLLLGRRESPYPFVPFGVSVYPHAED